MLRVVIAGYVICIVAYCTAPAIIPEIHTIDKTQSPDGQWIARRAVHAYASIFSSPDNVIILQQQGWSGIFKSKEICAIVVDVNPNLPQIEWRNAHELLIKIKHMPNHTDGIYRQLHDYEGVHISYEVK